MQWHQRRVHGESHCHIAVRDICVSSNKSRMVLLQPLARMMLRSTHPPRLMTSRQMSGGHDDSSWKVWKNLFFFAAVPVIIASTINAFYLADPHEMDPPPFVPYDHLRIRTKKFPWGDGNHSLIHNPHTNALPDGFEHEEHEH